MNCIALAVTPNLEFALANVIIGCEKYSSNHIQSYCVFVPSDDVDKFNTKILSEISNEKIRLIPEKINCFDDKKLLDLKNKYTESVLYKFNIFKLLEEFEKIIWLDVDVLIQDDFSELFSIKEPIAWRRSSVKLNRRWKTSTAIDDSWTMPNAGMIFLQKSIKSYVPCSVLDNIFEFVKEVAINSKDIFIDEISFGALVHRYKIPLQLVDNKYNAHPFWGIAENAPIVHFAGKFKPWTNNILNLVFYEWEKNNKRYRKLVGNKAKLIRDFDIFTTKADLISGVLYNDYWTKLFESYDLSSIFKVRLPNYSNSITAYISRRIPVPIVIQCSCSWDLSYCMISIHYVSENDFHLIDKISSLSFESKIRNDSEFFLEKQCYSLSEITDTLNRLSNILLNL